MGALFGVGAALGLLGFPEVSSPPLAGEALARNAASAEANFATATSKICCVVWGFPNSVAPWSVSRLNGTPEQYASPISVCAKPLSASISARIGLVGSAAR